jgi:hypothetical protein
MPRWVAGYQKVTVRMVMPLGMLMGTVVLLSLWLLALPVI